MRLRLSLRLNNAKTPIAMTAVPPMLIPMINGKLADVSTSLGFVGGETSSFSSLFLGPLPDEGGSAP